MRITVQVASFDDGEALGMLLEQILGALGVFPPLESPEPNSGYLGVTFQAGINELHLWFIVAYGESARATRSAQRSAAGQVAEPINGWSGQFVRSKDLMV